MKVRLTEAGERTLRYMAGTGCLLGRYGNSTAWTIDAYQWPVATAVFEFLLEKGLIKDCHVQTSNIIRQYRISEAGVEALR